DAGRRAGRASDLHPDAGVWRLRRGAISESESSLFKSLRRHFRSSPSSVSPWTPRREADSEARPKNQGELFRRAKPAVSRPGRKLLKSLGRAFRCAKSPVSHPLRKPLKSLGAK